MATAENPHDPSSESLHVDSIVVSAGRPHEPGSPVNTGLFPTSIFHEGGPYTYGRDGNPTWAALEDVLGQMEQGTSITFSSGIAAINAVLDTVPAGGIIVAPDHPYSGTGARLNELAAKGLVTVRRVNMADTAAIFAALDGAYMLWLESPTNPMMEVCDLVTVCAEAKQQGILIGVDNTFATALVQRPLDMGADFSFQSATKYIGGHSDLLLGVVTVRNVEYADALRKRRVMLGATPGSLEAWLALRGVRTMSLRVARSMNSAMEIAERLNAHPAVGRVLYPGLAEHPQHALATKQMRGYGGVISFTVAAGKEAAQQMCESLTLITHATSLGGVESTIERRARHALEHVDVPENLVRLSVGIEDVSDLWRELETALSRTLS